MKSRQNKPTNKRITRLFSRIFKAKAVPSGTYSMKNERLQTVHDSETGLLKVRDNYLLQLVISYHEIL